MIFFYILGFAIAAEGSLEGFLNRHQDLAYKIDVKIGHKKSEISRFFHGVFYWHKDGKEILL